MFFESTTINPAIDSIPLNDGPQFLGMDEIVERIREFTHDGEGGAVKHRDGNGRQLDPILGLTTSRYLTCSRHSIDLYCREYNDGRSRR